MAVEYVDIALLTSLIEAAVYSCAAFKAKLVHSNLMTRHEDVCELVRTRVRLIGQSLFSANAELYITTPGLNNRRCMMIDTWLILPAVICLSQRLSHACLCTSRIMVKPRMAHYNSHCLLDLDYPTWITVVILELIHAIKLRPYGTSAFIRPKPIGPRPERFGDSE